MRATNSRPHRHATGALAASGIAAGATIFPLHDIIAFLNGAAIDPTDYAFA
jgi:hypothetical protein